jgi:uncharacterized protein YuzE
MRLTYHPDQNVAYIRLREKREDVTPLRLGDDVVVDLAPDGTLYGIELLNAREQIAEDGSRLIVDSARGHEEVALEGE